MSEKQLRDLIEIASNICEKLFDARGEVRMMWHAFTEDGDQLLVPPALDLSKDDNAALIRALFDIRKVVRYVFICEAWLGHEHPIDESTCVEIVLITGEDAEAGQIVGRREIFRPSGKRPYLGPLQIAMYPQGSEGRLIGMLPAHGTRQ